MQAPLRRRVHRWMRRRSGIFLVVFMLIAIGTAVSAPRATEQRRVLLIAVPGSPAVHSWTTLVSRAFLGEVQMVDHGD